MAGPALSVAIVTYETPRRLLAGALASLATAVQRARDAGLAGEAAVFVIDNTPGGSPEVAQALRAWPAETGELRILAGHGNLGYGRANNLVLPRLTSEAHLVMNPDVELEPDALSAALSVLREHPGVGLVAPAVYGDDGEPQFLCRRYPSVWVLYLRGFAPEYLRRRFARTLEEYEMRDVLGAGLHCGVPLASGCFMLARTALFARLGGFDPSYFMYFEDYDLSLRIGREAQVAYAPRARIVHHGGEAARKGLKHVAWFVRSAWRFFARHGWRIA
jgi:GT2 family glycosyltransferase